MKGYIIKSLLQVIPVLLLVSLIVFILVRVTGDPVALMLPETATAEDRAVLTEALGLDQPLYKQYITFLGSALQGDFGTSFRYGESALPLVLERLPASFELAVAAMIFAIIMAIPLGILSAVKRNTFTDLLISGISVIGKAMPNFWMGIMLILFFSVMLGALPVSGRGGIEHLLLPAFTLGIGIGAQMTRLVRSSMLEILNQDYILTAKSKGLRPFIIIMKHAFRNGLIPVVTIVGLQFTSLIGGTLITETVFAWPGLGQLLVTAVNTHDMAIVQASVFVIALIVIIGNLLTDISYRLLDPRIRYS
ncbi:ABC transporter permease [Paenibacillus sp. PK4536]|uniref:Glutathione transport system permease protein GsiC n=1 Tax=Paenibacillus nuruki TaxID=1886670 RepID=A0A1E3L7I9_9BACL|nr:MULTISPECIES: ABC transporter permease [Paenibacillus]ODP29739.1 Glutathione transport system permease protein GsiC [Paenibacillus nuruki]WIM37698.1 ABC transporter permease [Paenibacillus sp. PK4536]CAJ1315658.1 Glutathione transport system permease protein GsiC [Paenibacillus nuruki]